MAAGSIIVDLLMRTGSFVTDTDRAAKRLRQFEKDVVDAGKRIATGVAAIAGGIGAGLAIVDRIASGIANYQDIADQIGDTASSVSTLQLAADQSGTALDTVASASVKLTAALSKVSDDADPTARALAAINIPLEEFRALSPVEQLNRVAAELAKFEDGAAKTAVAVQLFGRSGAELIPFLNDLAESQGRNVGLTQEQIDSADRFSKGMATLRSELLQVARTVAADLIPPFQTVLDFLREGSSAGGTFQAILSFIGSTLRVAFETVAVLGANVLFVFGAVGREIGAITAQLAALGRGDIQGFRAISEAVKADAARARAELDAFERRVMGLGGASPAAPQAPPQRPTIDDSGLRKSGATSASTGSRSASFAAPRVSEAERYLESLQRQLERTKDLSVTEQLLADIQAGRLGKVTAAQNAALRGVAEQIDASKRMADQLRAEEQQVRELEQYQERLRSAGAAVYEATRTPLEQLAAEQARLNDLLQKGAIDWDTYSRAVFNAQDAYDRTAQAAGQTAETVDGFTKRFAENAQDQLGQGLYDLMSGNFKNIGDGFVDMVNRMVAEAIAADIAKALFGDLLKGGEGDGIFGGILKSFKDVLGGASAGGGTFGSGGGGLLQTLGAGLSSFFGGAFAGGGDVFGGRPILVGEQGPEMFVPRTAGTVLPAAQTAAMGRQLSVNAPITIAVSGAVDRRTREQIAADVQRAVGSAVARGTA